MAITGVAVGVGLGVAVGLGVGALVAALVAARVGAMVGAGVDGAIVAAGAMVGAGVDGALVAAAGACVGASVASSSPQATISRSKTIIAPTREYTRQCLDHCVLFMSRYLLDLRGNPVPKLSPGGVVVVDNILGVSKFDVNP